MFWVAWEIWYLIHQCCRCQCCIHSITAHQWISYCALDPPIPSSLSRCPPLCWPLVPSTDGFLILWFLQCLMELFDDLLFKWSLFLIFLIFVASWWEFSLNTFCSLSCLVHMIHLYLLKLTSSNATAPCPIGFVGSSGTCTGGKPVTKLQISRYSSATMSSTEDIWNLHKLTVYDIDCQHWVPCICPRKALLWWQDWTIEGLVLWLLIPWNTFRFTSATRRG